MDTEGWQATGHRVAESDMTEATLDTAQDAKEEDYDKGNQNFLMPKSYFGFKPHFSAI